ncbi:MAG: twin-arginine translocase TatA/TatE family subunit [Thaumarchaeota archaeon]|nr:twin-arginine translocase TatA/TatE family subunit [Nitrososphaerota archaeon]
MAFGDPLQIIVIGIIVVVIFLWGPQKIPDLARAMGRAKKEFDDASKEGSTPTHTGQDMTADQALLEAASRLGIFTEGKTRAQISQEIVERARSRA